MILPDVNVLLYAFRPDVLGHVRYATWLEAQVKAGTPFGMSPQVLSAALRIATNPRVFAKPDPPEAVIEFAGAWLRHPNCQVVQPGPRHWEIFVELCRKANVRGNLVQDAWFAALAIESGCEWITADRDYARFPGLRWRAPF
jgi:toxin-antitoxin system PIN domain toxin